MLITSMIHPIIDIDSREIQPTIRELEGEIENLKQIWLLYKRNDSRILTLSKPPSEKMIRYMFTGRDKRLNVILLDGRFMSLLDRQIKSPILREIKNFLVKSCINKQVTKEDLQGYLMNLFDAQLKGRCTKVLLRQLFKLNLVPYKDCLPETLQPGWHNTVFYLTFRHDIFESRISV